MMRKFTHCVMLLSSLLLLQRCNDDDVSSPPKTTFTVDKTSGNANDTEFTFVVDQVNASSISILPYGTENASLGGVLVSGFTDGKATVKFKYAQVGTFNAVVVTNNHDGEGNLKNTYSDPIVITIGTSLTQLSDFTFDGATKTDTAAVRQITVTVPALTDVTKLKAKFNSSPFSTVWVGTTQQSSGTTVNDFTHPVTYTVKSNRGTTANYTVTVVVTAAEADNTLKAASGKEISKSRKNRVIPGSVDNVAHTIVLYDTTGTPADAFDSVRLNYTLNGKFALAKYNGKKLKQDSILNLTSSKQIVVIQQLDSIPATYDVYAKTAPLLQLSFPALNPQVTATTSYPDFAITANVLKGTNLGALVTKGVISKTGSVTVSSVVANGITVDLDNGTPLDLSKPTTFVLTVVDGSLTYKVNYTVTVTAVP
jgi:hypothetical protein